MFANTSISGAADVGRPKSKLGTKAQEEAAQMALESLESRVVLSYTFSYAGAVATAVGRRRSTRWSSNRSAATCSIASTAAPSAATGAAMVPVDPTLRSTSPSPPTTARPSRSVRRPAPPARSAAALLASWHRPTPPTRQGRRQPRHDGRRPLPLFDQHPARDHQRAGFNYIRAAVRPLQEGSPSWDRQSMATSTTSCRRAVTSRRAKSP